MEEKVEKWRQEKKYDATWEEEELRLLEEWGPLWWMSLHRPQIPGRSQRLPCKLEETRKQVRSLIESCFILWWLTRSNFKGWRLRTRLVVASLKRKESSLVLSPNWLMLAAATSLICPVVAQRAILDLSNWRIWQQLSSRKCKHRQFRLHWELKECQSVSVCLTPHSFFTFLSTSTANYLYCNFSFLSRDCKTKINSSCNPANIPQPNMTKIDACNALGKALSDGVKECKGKTGSEACSCWTNTTLKTTFDDLKKCNYKVTISRFA